MLMQVDIFDWIFFFYITSHFVRWALAYGGLGFVFAGMG